MPTPHSLLAALPDPVMLISAESEVVWANNTARVWFESDVTGRTAGTVFRSKDVSEALSAVLQDSRPHEVDYTLSALPQRDLRLKFVPLNYTTVENGCVLMTANDVTAFRNLDRARRDFIANASHELRTPLATLYGFIETLQGAAADDPDAAKTFLPIMHKHAQRMTRLVDDLLSLSRIEMETAIENGAPISLRELLSGVIDALSMHAMEREVTIELASERDATVMGNFSQIEQVFINLVENAIKYGRQGSTVTLRMKKARSDGMVAVQVIDQGEGIARKHLSRLTERFYRVEKARSREMGGTGLGLAIVKHILNRHEGTLNIKSKQGEGSTFEVRLPVVLEKED